MPFEVIIRKDRPVLKNMDKPITLFDCPLQHTAQKTIFLISLYRLQNNQNKMYVRHGYNSRAAFFVL